MSNQIGTVGSQQIAFDSTGGGGGAAPANAEFIVATPNPFLPNADVLVGGEGITLVNTGPGGTLTINADSADATVVTAGEGIAAGAPVAIADAAGTAKAFNGDANGAGTLRNIAGLAKTTVLLNAPLTIVEGGEVSVADAIWDVVPGTADEGKPFFTSETAGKLTIDTSAFATTSDKSPLGVISRGGAGLVKVIILIGVKSNKLQYAYDGGNTIVEPAGSGAVAISRAVADATAAVTIARSLGTIGRALSVTSTVTGPTGLVPGLLTDGLELSGEFVDHLRNSATTPEAIPDTDSVLIVVGQVAIVTKTLPATPTDGRTIKIVVDATANTFPVVIAGNGHTIGTFPSVSLSTPGVTTLIYNGTSGVWRMAFSAFSAATVPVDVDIFVDLVAGLDINPGTALLPVQTFAAAERLIPPAWRGHCRIHLVGAGPYPTTANLFVGVGVPVGPDASPLTVLGDALTQVATGTVGNVGVSIATTVATAATLPAGTVAAGLATGTISVVSTAGFPTAGEFNLTTVANGVQIVGYTGKTATMFTGCTFGSSAIGATIIVGAAVTAMLYVFDQVVAIPSTTIAAGSNNTNLPQGTINVGSTVGFPTSGQLFVTLSTLVAGASIGLTLPQATINVNSTTGFPTSGTINVTTSLGIEPVTYTGITATSFTGTVGGLGVMNAASLVDAGQTTVVTYTGVTATSFTGALGGGGTMGTGGAVVANYRGYALHGLTGAPGVVAGVGRYLPIANNDATTIWVLAATASANFVATNTYEIVRVTSFLGDPAQNLRVVAPGMVAFVNCGLLCASVSASGGGTEPVFDNVEMFAAGGLSLQQGCIASAQAIRNNVPFVRTLDIGTQLGTSALYVRGAVSTGGVVLSNGAQFIGNLIMTDKCIPIGNAGSAVAPATCDLQNSDIVHSFVNGPSAACVTVSEGSTFLSTQGGRHRISCSLKTSNPAFTVQESFATINSYDVTYCGSTNVNSGAGCVDAPFGARVQMVLNTGTTGNRGAGLALHSGGMLLQAGSNSISGLLGDLLIDGRTPARTWLQVTGVGCEPATAIVYSSDGLPGTVFNWAGGLTGGVGAVVQYYGQGGLPIAANFSATPVRTPVTPGRRVCRLYIAILSNTFGAGLGNTTFSIFKAPLATGVPAVVASLTALVTGGSLLTVSNLTGSITFNDGDQIDLQSSTVAGVGVITFNAAIQAA